MSVPHRPAPPPPSRPGHVHVVKALYPYTANRGDELSFEEGDLLYIIDKSDGSGWWKARVGNITGLIPSNYVDEHGETIDNPLHEAAKRGNVDFLNECLSNKISVNGFDKSGSTALHWAAHGGHLECVNQLLDSPKMSIDVQNKLGDTALHNAAWKGHAHIVEELLRRGANKSLKNNDNKTPYDIARNADSSRLLKEVKMSSNGDYGVDDDDDDES